MKKSLLTLLLASLYCVSFAQHTDTLLTTSGIKYFFTYKGTGPLLTPGWLAIWNYKVSLIDGTKIDATSDRDAPFASQYPSTHVIKGINEALSLMHIGDKATFILPSSLAYGTKGRPLIPPNSTLVFNIELLNMKAKSLEMVLDSILFEKPDTSEPHITAVLKTFDELKKKKFGDLYVSEDALNDIGYKLIGKFPNDAEEILKLNVELYPKSFNVYDSLGDGYAAVGNKALAIVNYEQALKINPKNTESAQKLAKLKTP